jgi:hypothetical protein
MSEERKKRKAERENPGQAMARVQKIVAAVLVAAAFAVVVFLGLRKRSHRLDAFAQCLASRETKMYGAYWCPHCAEQKEMFEASFQYVPYVECGVTGSRDEALVCQDAGVKHFPTWQFADNERQEGTLSLQSLGTKTGCPLP